MAPDRPEITVIAKEVDGTSATPKSASILAASASTTFAGPIPPPEFLAEYDKICPGLGDRLVKMAEDEAAHRRSIETKLTDAQVEDLRAGRREARRGQICALITVLAVVGGSVYIAAQGHEIAAGLLGIGGLGGVVATFIYGRDRMREENARQSGTRKGDKQSKKR